MTKYFEDHIKMKILHKMAEKDPNGMLAHALKMIDEELDKMLIEKMKEIESKKKQSAFVTKF